MFTYASQVWCPQSVELISNLEKIQRRATKFILGLPFITEVKRLQQLSLFLLSYWHEYLDLTFLFKVIDRHVRVSEEAYPALESIVRPEVPKILV